MPEKQHGGPRPGSGRPPIPSELKYLEQVQYDTRLPRWLVEWLRAQDQPATKLIEAALLKTYGLEPPDRKERKDAKRKIIF